jgi:hypothetical protein
MFIEKVMVSEQYIKLTTGTEIHVVGLDKPARIEGQPWNGGIVDEIADIKATAWQENIRPLFDTIGMEDSWCWLIGVPDGLNHYYDLAEYARTSGDPEWGFYTWKSSEILSEKAIASAKRQLDPRAFRQEYEACHLPETLVALFNGGCKKISELEKGDELIYINDSGCKEACIVLNSGYTKEKSIMEATLETGEIISSSPDHPYKV